MERVHRAVNHKVLGVRSPSNGAVWTDVLMHKSNFSESRDPICHDLRLRTKRHLQFATKILRNISRSFNIFFDPQPTVFAIGSAIEEVAQLFLGNPFERTRHGGLTD